MTENLSNDLHDSLQKLNRYMNRRMHKVFSETKGVHRGRVKLLKIIEKNDGIIQRDLAEILDMRPSSLTEMLVGLEKSSLIRREQDENDRRIMHVYIAEEGKKSLEEFKKEHSKTHESLFNSLTEEEKKSLFEIINKINKGFEEEEKNCDKKHDYHKKGHGYCHRHKHKHGHGSCLEEFAKNDNHKICDNKSEL